MQPARFPETTLAEGRAHRGAGPPFGYAQQAIRFERRLGWVLWTALVLVLIATSF